MTATFLSVDRGAPLQDGDFRTASGAPIGVLKQEGGRYGGLWDDTEHLVALQLAPNATGDSARHWTVWVDGGVTALRVQPVAFTGSPVPTPGNPPDVTLIEWDRSRGRSVLGARCGSHWCWIGMEENATVQVSPECAGNLAARGKCHEPGWADAQYLPEVRVSPSGKPLTPGPYARIVPSNNLGQHTQPSQIATWMDAAYIHAPANGYTKEVLPPEGDRDFKIPFLFVLAGGDNIIQIMRAETSQGSGQYHTDRMLARVVDGSGNPIDGVVYIMRRHGPGLRPPPVARWIFRPGDEGTWIECAAGCCEMAARALQ